MYLYEREKMGMEIAVKSCGSFSTKIFIFGKGVCL